MKSLKNDKQNSSENETKRTETNQVNFHSDTI